MQHTYMEMQDESVLVALPSRKVILPLFAFWGLVARLNTVFTCHRPSVWSNNEGDDVTMRLVE